jgi:hypothetical protein
VYFNKKNIFKKNIKKARKMDQGSQPRARSKRVKKKLACVVLQGQPACWVLIVFIIIIFLK